MITIKIREDDLLDALMERCEAWMEKDSITYRLFYDMYESYIDSGCFEDAEIDIMNIVDNDYINYCDHLHKDNLTPSDWEKICKAWDDGERDISCEDFDYGNISFIEAKIDDDILVRY